MHNPIKAALHLRADILAVQTERAIQEARHDNERFDGVFKSRENIELFAHG